MGIVTGRAPPSHQGPIHNTPGCADVAWGSRAGLAPFVGLVDRGAAGGDTGRDHLDHLEDGVVPGHDVAHHPNRALPGVGEEPRLHRRQRLPSDLVRPACVVAGRRGGNMQQRVWLTSSNVDVPAWAVVLTCPHPTLSTRQRLLGVLSPSLRALHQVYTFMRINAS